MYLDGVVREMNAMVPGDAVELLLANGGRFEINQLLLADGWPNQKRSCVKW